MSKGKDGTPMPPGYNPESFENHEEGVQDAPKVTVVKDVPADAKQANVETKSEGWFQRAWRMVKAAADAVSGAIGFVVTKVVRGVSWAYSWTLGPALSFVERWVPGMKYLRKTLFFYGVYIVLMGTLLGGMVFTVAGSPLSATILGMAYGAVLLPWILVTTPALYLTILSDIAVLSVGMIILSTILVKLLNWSNTSFWAMLGHELWPGLYENVADWLDSRAEATEQPEPVAVAA